MRNGIVRKLVWFHRWLGIATCLIFALWFASGAVLLFVPFPALPFRDQLALEAPVAMGDVAITPAQALATGGPADALRLVQRGNRPVYVLTRPDARVAVVDAGTGALLSPMSPATASRIAGRIGATATPASFDYDQWIVHNRFDPTRPFYRLDRDDHAGTQLYLSARTGELLQRTTRSQRGWTWVGAVLHWAYVTPLRSSFTAWDRTVWWLSLVAMLVAIAGTILGIVRTLAAQRQRTPALTFFRPRWLRWHHLIGLFASLFVLTWIFSGWLSMDHGRLFSRGTMTQAEAAAFRGGSLADGLRDVALAPIREATGVREVQFSAVASQAIVTMWGADGSAHVLNATGATMPPQAVDALAEQGITRGWAEPASRPLPVPATDIYALAEGWPATARVSPGNGAHPDIVFDGATGRVLTVNSTSRKAYAWVYYALHTFEIPGLIERPVLRDVIVLIPLALGFIFCITGVVIGWQRLRRAVTPRRSKA